ncbi:MAG TPA: hypothetical protein V6D08_19210 [Candidatus Obscuribacterales bacterium]
MRSHLESLNDNRLLARTEPGLAERLFNEAYVMTAGLLGSFGELRAAAEQATERPAATLAKIGTGAALGTTLGFLSTRAGFAGLAARGIGAALGVSFVADAIKPFSTAAERAWNAGSGRELDYASRELSASLSSFTFDTLLIAPFAVGGSFAGRGLRAAFSEGATVTRSAAATDNLAGQRSARPAGSQGFSSRLNQNGREYRAFTGAGATTARKPAVEVLEGEIIDAPRPSARPSRVQEPEIIDAEFVVVSEVAPESRLALPGKSESLPVRYSPSQGMFQVALRGDGQLSLRSTDALRALQRLEPGWQLTSEGLLSPRHSQLTPEQIKRALRAYLDHSQPEPGRIIDIRA